MSIVILLLCLIAQAGQSLWFSRRYRQHLFRRHRFLDLRGCGPQGIYPLELERVFVELTLTPQPIHQASTGSGPLVPEAARKGQGIWYYLSAGQMAHQNLVIIGPPGSGKTTLLKQVALRLAAGRRARRGLLRNAPPRARLPILLLLRDHAKAIQENPDLSLAQAVQDSLARWKLRMPGAWFEAHLEKGRCLVLLDGLDDLADPGLRGQVMDWIQRQMETWAENRFVVASRPSGYYTHQLDGVTVLQISPLSREQVQRFVHNWYTARAIRSAQPDGPRVAPADLLRRLYETSLATNPLLLTLMAIVDQHQQWMGQSHLAGALVQEVCEIFLGQHRQARGPDQDLTPAQKQRVLQPLAYHLMCQQQCETAREDALAVIGTALAQVSPDTPKETFLKRVVAEGGLLLERGSGDGIYGFAHRTFQEYLAAAHALDQNLGAELSSRVGEDWWHECIRLYAAQTDASPIIAACLADDWPTIPVLILAIECGKDAREIQPEVRQQLEDALARAVEDPEPEHRRILAEVLLALRLRRLVPVDETRYVDNTLLTHAEYQLFLDEMRAHGKYHQPDHWSDCEFPIGQGSTPIVGVRPSDANAFCDWLTGRETGGWSYRLLRSDELDAGATRDLLQTGQGEQAGYWVQSEQGFECIRPDGASHVMSQTELEEQVDRDLAQILAHGRVPDLARDLIHDLTRARARARPLDSDLTGDLASARSIACDLARTHDFDLALGLAHNLVRDLGDAHGRARALYHDLERDFDRNHDLDLDRALARNLDHALDRALTHARNVARTLDLVRALDHICTRALAMDLDRALNLDLARDLVRVRTLDRNRDLDIDRDLARTRARARDLTWDRSRDLILAHASARDLARDLAREHVRDMGLGSVRSQASTIQGNTVVSVFLRWYVRLYVLLLAAELFDLLPKQQPQPTHLRPDHSASEERTKEIQRLVEAYLDLYVEFAILEARAQGTLPAFEGIRLVKEHRMASNL